jgi:hypothetical protein
VSPGSFGVKEPGKQKETFMTTRMIRLRELTVRYAVKTSVDGAGANRPNGIDATRVRGRPRGVPAIRVPEHPDVLRAAVLAYLVLERLEPLLSHRQDHVGGIEPHLLPVPTEKSVRIVKIAVTAMHD